MKKIFFTKMCKSKFFFPAMRGGAGEGARLEGGWWWEGSTGESLERRKLKKKKIGMQKLISVFSNSKLSCFDRLTSVASTVVVASSNNIPGTDESGTKQKSVLH